MNSIWIRVDGFDRYMVSPEGNILSTETQKRKTPLILKKKKEKAGYLTVNLFNDKVDKYVKIHRIVATAFCVKPEGCNVVNHIDGNRENNHYLNLEWVNNRQNTWHGINVTKTINVVGENNPSSKLNRHEVKIIKDMIKDGKSIAEISKVFKVSKSCIYGIRLGKTWNK